MKVILREDIDKLGKCGEIVEVKNGYGRNFLLARNLAIPASKGNVRAIGEVTHQKSLRDKKHLKEAERIKLRIEKASCMAEVNVGEEDKVFGSVTSAMIVDLLSMVSMSLFFTGVENSTPLFLIAAVACVFFLPKVGKWIFKRYKRNLAEVELRFILLTLVGLSFLSEQSGVHATIFAYIMGIMFSSLLIKHEEVEKKLKGIVYGFFGPLFFFNSGYLIDLKQLDMNTIKLVIILTVVAFIGKYVGTRFSVQKILGQGSIIAGYSFNFRLTFGIIVALLGYQEGIIDKNIYILLY